MMTIGRTGPSVQLSAIIIRACNICQGKREIGKPCETCGNRDVPKVTDLGVIASNQRNWWERLKWSLLGYRVAQRRIRRTNQEMIKQHSLEGCGE